MHNKGMIIIILTLTLLLISTVHGGVTYALIIGVGDYEEEGIGNLPTAIKDAEKFADTLMRMGIAKKENITLLKNPKYTDILVEIEMWIEQGEKDDKMFFYYGGHSEQGKNEDGKTDIYLMPADVRSANLERTSYNFRKEWQERLSQKLQAKETLMLFDTCYAGGITRERSYIKDIKIRSLEFEKIAEEKGVNFLLSSKEDQTSKEMPSQQGGWFTYYLLEGIKTGEANYNNDLTIDIEEISRYLEERVSASTRGEQTPISILGKKDMKVADDETLLYERIKNVIIEQYLLGNLKEENSKIYIKILNQESTKDTEEEAKIRLNLKKYYDDRDIEVLEALTDRIFQGTEQQPEIDEQKFEVEVQEIKDEKTTGETKVEEGSCIIQIFGLNEITEGANVYLNDVLVGKINHQYFYLGVVPDSYRLKIDSAKMKAVERNFELKGDYDIQSFEIYGEKATRMVRIITNPPAEILFNEIKTTGISQQEIEVGIEYPVECRLSGYVPEIFTINVAEKGELFTKLVSMRCILPPTSVIPITPKYNERHYPFENSVLEWRATDPQNSLITYTVLLGENPGNLNEMIYKGINKSYILPELKRNTQYFWRVIAENEYGEKTEGNIFTFATKPNQAPEIEEMEPIGEGQEYKEVTLSWGVWDEEADAVKATVYFGTEKNKLKKLKETGYSNIELSTKDMMRKTEAINEAKVTNLERGQTYYWKVFVEDEYGGKTDSGLKQFRTKENQKPELVGLIQPKDETKPEEVRIGWEFVDKDEDPMYYSVYFGESRQPKKVKEVYSSQYTPKELQFGQTYYWKVEAIDEYGGKTETAIQSFTTRRNSSPEINLISPFDQSKGIQWDDVTLKWHVKDKENDDYKTELYLGKEKHKLEKMSIDKGLASYTLNQLERGQTYYWQIIATDVYGYTNESPIYTFTTKPNQAPEILEMQPLGTGQEHKEVTLRWEIKEPEHDEYKITVYTGKDKNKLEKIKETNFIQVNTENKNFIRKTEDTNEKKLESLERGQTYYWQIIVEDKFGGETESGLKSFTTKENKNPQLVKITNPDDGINPKDTQLSWVFKDEDNDSLSYLLYFGKSAPPDVIGTTIFTDYSPWEIEFNQTYYWKIEADDGYGGKTESDIQSFTTRKNTPPEINLISPSNNGKNTQWENVILKWHVRDHENDSYRNELYFGKEKHKLEAINIDKEAVSYTTNQLERGQQYYWQIVSTDEYDYTNESPIYSFTTKANQAPEIKEMLPVGEEQAYDEVTLSWQVQDLEEDAIKATVYFGKEQNNLEKIKETEYSNRYLTAKNLARKTEAENEVKVTNLERGQVYYWNVIIEDEYGAKTDSGLRNFKTQANNIPVLINLDNPKDGENPKTVSLEWEFKDLDADTLSYKLYFGETKTPQVMTYTALTRYQPDNLKFDTTYYWQILAEDGYGGSAKSEIMSFKTRANIIKQFRIETSPTNADIYINNQYMGKSPLTNEFQEGSHSIESRKDGYRTKTTIKTIDAHTKDLSRVETILLTMEKETGSITINSDPSGATIYINGNKKGITATTIDSIEPGTYTLKLTKNGYKDKTQTLTINAGKNEMQRITLEKEKTTGTLSIKTSPSIASIYINSTYKGTSPKVIETLEEGTYRLKITKTGYEEQTTTVKVQKEKTTEIVLQLEKQPIEEVTTQNRDEEETGFGYLKIEDNTGKNYSLDGERKGWVVPKAIKLDVGKHTIEIEGRGEVQIEIKENETTLIDNKTKFDFVSSEKEVAYSTKKIDTKEMPIFENFDSVPIGDAVLNWANISVDGGASVKIEGFEKNKNGLILRSHYDDAVSKVFRRFNNYYTSGIVEFDFKLRDNRGQAGFRFRNYSDGEYTKGPGVVFMFSDNGMCLGTLFLSKNDGNVYWHKAASLSVNKWYHVKMVFNLSNNGKYTVYLDGKKVANDLIKANSVNYFQILTYSNSDNPEGIVFDNISMDLN